MMSQRIKGVIGLMFAILLFLAVFLPGPVAAEGIDKDRPSQMTIQHMLKNEPLVDVGFHVYRVADVSADSGFTLAGSFKDYPVELNDLDDAGYLAAASTLYAYAVADKIQPTTTGKTDAQGHLVISDLETGLYLIVGEEKILDDKGYTPIPMLASLPMQDESGTWQYQVLVVTKLTVKPIEPEPKKVTRHVVKIWEDNEDCEKKRPKEVIVDLFRDGFFVESVALTQQNAWSYTWEDLDDNASWTVVERNIPEGYTVTYATWDLVLGVKNSYTPQKPPDPDPTDPKLPQTGQLWWPVSVAAGLGLFFFIVGWYLVFRGRQKDEA